MRGIDNIEHRKLIQIFEKYKYESVAVKTASEDDLKIYENMEELDVLYTCFKTLLLELQRCVKDYEVKKRSTQSIIHKKLRRIKNDGDKK
ncbi:hypothetical protein [Flavobacterium sp.]|uniref:hypothetical protein n=1 Tax=Flavobacterium sp. TaxID=239 RepID=UPI0031D838C3